MVLPQAVLIRRMLRPEFLQRGSGELQKLVPCERTEPLSSHEIIRLVNRYMNLDKPSQTAAKWSRMWPIALPLLVVVVSLTVLWVTTPLRERMVADQLASQLTDADLPQIRTTLQALADLDESGLATLVRLLDSTNPAVVTAAKQTLDRQIEDWRVRGATYWSPRVEVFVGSLADHAEQFRPHARRQAAVYAAELMQWPTENEVVDRVDILVACDQVLHIADSARIALQETTESRLPTKGTLDSSMEEARKTNTMDEQIEKFASLPGGGLPINVEVISELPTRPQVRSAATPLPPRTLMPRTDTLPIDQDAENPSSKTLQDSTSGKRAESRSLRWGNARQVGGQLTASDTDGPTLQRVDSTEFVQTDKSNGQSMESLALLDVIAQLIAEDEDIVFAAERELIRRGFNSRESKFARRLAAADVKMRREMVTALPHLQGIDTRRWLLLLTEDPDADVRLSAYRWLATTADVLTLKRIHRAARQDQDLRIRRLAAEISGAPRRLR